MSTRGSLGLHLPLCLWHLPTVTFTQTCSNPLLHKALKGGAVAGMLWECPDPAELLELPPWAEGRSCGEALP